MEQAYGPHMATSEEVGREEGWSQYPAQEQDRDDSDGNGDGEAAQDEDILFDSSIISRVHTKPTATNTTSLAHRQHHYSHNGTSNSNSNHHHLHLHHHHRPHNQIRQPVNSIVNILPATIIQDIFEHVDQFDLVQLSLTCKQFYHISISRLYKRITVILNGEFPIRYNGDSKQYIRDNGIKYMNSSIILSIENLLKLFGILNLNSKLIQRVKFFIFDKCYINSIIDINHIQFKIIEFFGKNSHEINFLHITFIDFLTGILKLTKFLKNENIRSKIFKLFITNTSDLYQPIIPQSLTNLFLMLNELEFVGEEQKFDLSKYPYNVFYSLFTLTCSTNKQIGLEILSQIKLIDPQVKLKLKGLTIFHFHKESFTNVENDMDNPINLNELYQEGEEVELEDENLERLIYIDEATGEDHQQQQNQSDHDNNDKVLEYLKTVDKRLQFKPIQEKVDLLNLQHLYLKIDCIEHRLNNCKCFEIFFKDFSQFSVNNGGLVNLNSFEIESFPNLEWLRPHQMLEDILTPLGNFIKTLNGLTRLTIDFSTPGFKMFDNSIGLSTHLLNKLNERLIEAFFLCFIDNVNDGDNKNVMKTIKQLYLQDFLTSFIYYKPDFYENLLHTCQCWGCQLVLDKLKELFYPIDSHINESFMTAPNVNSNLDLESTYYMLIGYILGKLQADREVCIPIKESTFHYNQYPIYKGQPHTLHNAFHISNPNGDGPSNGSCKCDEIINDDPNCLKSTNIDNLVTIYIIHQLNPIVEYLHSMFTNLNNLMIHGIYYEYNKEADKLLPIFDDYIYPAAFLAGKEFEIENKIKPNSKFGYFRNRK